VKADDLNIRRAALTRLAVATRERLPDARADRDAFFHVYLDGLDTYSTDTFVRACKHLETALSWFPKKHELVEACQSIVRQKRDSERPVLALPPGQSEIDPGKLADFRHRVRELLERKSMP
jgi:hypothetical protein